MNDTATALRITQAQSGSVETHDAVNIRDLNEEDSLKLQEVGIGGRRRMGCGIFVPETDRDRGE